MTTPDRLGKYEITEVLGRGAMGVVYKGFDPGIRRTVAIKTIRRELIEGDRPAAALLALVGTVIAASKAYLGQEGPARFDGRFGASGYEAAEGFGRRRCTVGMTRPRL